MDLKKVKTNDIYCCIKQNMDKLYKELQDQLGNDNPFAKMNTGGGFYVWTDQRDGWRQMIAASEIQQQSVREALTRTKELVGKRLLPSTTDVLFTYPDDGYVYYNDEEGEIRVLLTGWGFKKPRRQISKPDRESLEEKEEPIKLSFSINGIKQPNYEFAIQLPSMKKHLITDAGGYYVIGKMKTGERQKLFDNKGDEHILEVKKGQVEYDFDVTPPPPPEQIPEPLETPLVIDIPKKETPKKEEEVIDDKKEPVFFPYIRVKDEENNVLTGYPVTLEIGNRLFDKTTDDDGVTPLDMINSGENIIVRDGNNSENCNEFVITKEQEEYLFVIPKEPEKQYTIKILGSNNMPIVCESVKIEQQDMPVINAKLNSEGCVIASASELKSGKPITVTLNGTSLEFAPIVFNIDDGEYEYVLQEQELKPQQNKMWLAILLFIVGTIAMIASWSIVGKICNLIDIAIN